MVTKKKTKSKDWLDEQADQINEAFAEELSKLTEEDIPRLTGKKNFKQVKGSHLTITYDANDYPVKLEWDDEALLRDVRAAILKFESNIPAAKTTAKKKAAAMTAKKKKVTKQ
jgi:hypothetical protein